MKEKLLPIANNQRQITESSATIAVLGDLEAYRNGEDLFDEAVAEGRMRPEARDTMLDNIRRAYRSESLARDGAIRNASLAAMQLMLAAKSLGYDTCPMGGYDAKALMQAFHVPARYLPVMLITVGTASKPAHATVRFPLERVVVNESFEQA